MWRVLILTFTFTFLSKALLHYIDNATDLSRKMLSPLKNVCNSEAVFPLTDTYVTQVI